MSRRAAREMRRSPPNSWRAEFPLVGPGGETIDLWRTLISHGLAYLPPMNPDDEARTLEITLSVDGTRPRTVRIGSGRRGFGEITVLGRRPGQQVQQSLMATVRHVLRLDEDLSEFYAQAAQDPNLDWATKGAGRMIRSPTVFEDVVKTICTTNCTWSATERMVAAIVEHLGERAPGAPDAGWRDRAFPSAADMSKASEDFYRKVARAGYRSKYLVAVARAEADGSVDLEALGRATPEELPDAELADHLLALPGIGPYAASHIMLILGRYSRLVLDSWTRPKYARLMGRSAVKDSAIERRFRRYGQYAGLAFWLFLTRDWVSDPSQVAAEI